MMEGVAAQKTSQMQAAVFGFTKTQFAQMQLGKSFKMLFVAVVGDTDVL